MLVRITHHSCFSRIRPTRYHFNELRRWGHVSRVLVRIRATRLCLVAVSRLLLVRVVCSHSEQRERLKGEPIIARFGNLLKVD